MNYKSVKTNRFAKLVAIWELLWAKSWLTATVIETVETRKSKVYMHMNKNCSMLVIDNVETQIQQAENVSAVQNLMNNEK